MSLPISSWQNFSTAEVEEFVAEAGDEVQLSCPVKTSGKNHLSFFGQILWLCIPMAPLFVFRDLSDLFHFFIWQI